MLWSYNHVLLWSIVALHTCTELHCAHCGTKGSRNHNHGHGCGHCHGRGLLLWSWAMGHGPLPWSWAMVKGLGHVLPWPQSLPTALACARRPTTMSIAHGHCLCPQRQNCVSRPPLHRSDRRDWTLADETSAPSCGLEPRAPLGVRLALCVGTSN